MLAGTLISFGMRQVIGEGAESVLSYLKGRFTDAGRALPRALASAHERAWRALEVALAGEGLTRRLGNFFAPGEDKALAEQFRCFLDAAGPIASDPAEFRRACLDELRAARARGDLSPDRLAPEEVARQADDFRRYTQPDQLIAAGWEAAGTLADRLAPTYPRLAELIRRPIPSGPPLFLAAFGFFFRREAEEDPELARGLVLDGLRQLSEGQEQALVALENGLKEVGGRIDGLLDEVRDQLGRIESAVGETHGAVLDLHAELQRLAGRHAGDMEDARRLLEEVMARLARLGMQIGEVHPRQSFSIHNDEERRAVRQLLARFRELPAEQQREVPALLNGLGKLQVGAGDFAEARATFTRVAGSVADAGARAEAQYNAYRAALEEKKFDEALAALADAAALDPGRFAPFPLKRYRLVRVLGAGGFGTVFLCRDAFFRDREVAIKSLHAVELERCLLEVFGEAHALTEVNHPAIIGVLDCNYADLDTQARPYIVMPYFPGTTLTTYLRACGPLGPEALLPVALPIARGMRAAHAQGILHRDLKPDNVLVRPPNPAKGREGWEVKIIDFGLALRRQAIESSLAVSGTNRTVLADSVAGSLLYAPPEQLGRLPGVKPGPYSDVYAFGKLCCFALFHNTEPRSRQLNTLPDALRDLLEACLEHDLEYRRRTFDEVLAVLEPQSPGGGSRPTLEPPPPPEPAGRKTWWREPEPARDPREGERLLAEEVRAALDRGDGKLSREDRQALREICLRHDIERERAEVIFTNVEMLWQNARRRSHRRGPRAAAAVVLGGLSNLGEWIRESLGEGEGPRPGEVRLNSVGMRLAWVPPGEFLMGSPPDEEGRDEDELQHPVTLSRGFHLGVCPVTQAQWRAVMGSLPGHFKGKDRPVECVSWEDAREFCRKLSRREGARYRLPTEAEWEYACRAGTTTPFAFGRTISPAQANYDGTASYGPGTRGEFRQQTTPVASFPPNAWGLFDMHGNVWEWCADWYGPYPKAAADPEGSPSGTLRVLRGGAWYFNPRNCRSACRARGAPGYRNSTVGFRVALDVEG